MAIHGDEKTTTTEEDAETDTKEVTTTTVSKEVTTKRVFNKVAMTTITKEVTTTIVSKEVATSITDDGTPKPCDNSTSKISVGATTGSSLDGQTLKIAVTVDGIKIQGTEVNNGEVTTKEDPTPAVEHPNYAKGPAYYSHIDGYSGCLDPGSRFYIDRPYIIKCPACSFNLGKQWDSSRSKVKEMDLTNIRKGYHVENHQVVLQESGLVRQSLSKGSVVCAKIDGESISQRGPPEFGLDVLCPYCAWEIGLCREKLSHVRQGEHSHDRSAPCDLLELLVNSSKTCMLQY